LRVARIKDVCNRSLDEIQATIVEYKEKGVKLTLEDQDTTSCCYVLTTLGKSAPEQVMPTLPRGITGILGIGRINDLDGMSQFNFNVCHATLTGSEGANLLMNLADRVKNLNTA